MTGRRLAYADPPYVGGTHRYDHPDAAVWAAPAAHIELMADLDASYDGWALSASAMSLPALCAGAPADVRVAAWVKPFSAYKSVRIAFTWEPVLFRPPPETRPDDPWVRDHLVESIRTGSGLVGAKPARFVRWMLALLAWQPGDEVVDLFPGTGTVADVLNQGVLELTVVDQGTLL